MRGAGDKFLGLTQEKLQILKSQLSGKKEQKWNILQISFVRPYKINGQVENAENAEKDEKVVKCEKSCLLNQNMGKKPLWQTKASIRKTKKKFPRFRFGYKVFSKKRGKRGNSFLFQVLSAAFRSFDK